MSHDCLSVVDNLANVFLILKSSDHAKDPFTRLAISTVYLLVLISLRLQALLGSRPRLGSNVSNIKGVALHVIQITHPTSI